MIHNILSNKPHPPYEITMNIFPIVIDLLSTHNHAEIVEHSSWSIDRLLDSCEDNAKEI